MDHFAIPSCVYSICSAVIGISSGGSLRAERHQWEYVADRQSIEHSHFKTSHAAGIERNTHGWGDFLN
jgi:hypothetical protein